MTTHANQNSHRYMPDEALTGGHWAPDKRGIQRWIVDPKPVIKYGRVMGLENPS